MTTRDRLVESTQELLWERGYVGTSPRAILDRAEAGQGSLYHHFSGKADLALAAVQRSADRLQAAAQAQFSGPGTAIERVAAWLLRERDVLRGCPIGRLTQDPEIFANPALRRPVDQTLTWVHHRLTDVLAEGQAKGEFAAGLDAADTAAAIVAVLQGGHVLARASNSTAPFLSAVHGVLALLSSHAPTTRPSKE